jgi:uncharacterized membrane protein
MWIELLTELLTKHRGKFIGALFGLVFGILVITLGFLQTVFVATCLYVGYIIGKRIDDDNETLRDVVERIFKER